MLMESAIAAGVAATTIAIRKAADRLVNDLYSSGAASIQTLLGRRTVAARQKDLCRKIGDVKKVRTLWAIDKPQDLHAFYYPSRLEVDNETIEVGSLRFNDLDKRLLVEGSVGQGKSIFLRYLTCRELLYKQVVPVFMELRNVDFRKDFAGQVCEHLQVMGFEPKSELLEYLVEKRKLVLFLDGADEIATEHHKNAVAEVHRFVQRFDSLSVMVTSRPNGLFAESPLFSKSRISYLSQNDIPPFIRRLHNGKEIGERLVAALAAAPDRILGVLNTPLTLNLLSLHYQHTSQVPGKLVEFYENLFEILLQRHDSKKPGYTGDRKCKLDLAQMRSVFDAFCFATALKEQISFSRKNAEKMAKSAGELVSMDEKCSAAAFVADIEKVTNLIVEDGLELKFPHKTIQEFHAASFVQSIPSEEASEKMYQLVLKSSPKWAGVVSFLSAIDRYRYFKYAVEPLVRRLFPDLVLGDFSAEAVIPVIKRELKVAVDGADGEVHVWHPGALLNQFQALVVDRFLGSNLSLDWLFFGGGTPLGARAAKAADAIRTERGAGLVSVQEILPHVSVKVAQRWLKLVESRMSQLFGKLHAEKQWCDSQTSGDEMVEIIEALRMPKGVRKAKRSRKKG